MGSLPNTHFPYGSGTFCAEIDTGFLQLSQN